MTTTEKIAEKALVKKVLAKSEPTETATPATDGRVELAWVQFMTPTWPQRKAFRGEPMIQAGEGQFQDTRLFLGVFAGIPVVFVEDPKAVQPARIPVSSVAGFGEK